jgi:hypothetical protein
VAELAGGPTTVGVGELEGPKEVVGLLEVRTNGGDLVDEILNTDEAVLAEVLLDGGVVAQGDALLVDLSVSALVDQLANGLKVGGTVSDVRVNQLEHLSSGVGEAEEDTVVNLEKTEQLEDLAGLRSDVVDTLDTDNEDQLGLGRNIEVTSSLSLAVETNLITLLGAVFANVLVSALEDDATLGKGGLASLSQLGSALGGGLLLSLPLLQKSLWDKDLLVGGDSAIRMRSSENIGKYPMDRHIRRNKTCQAY